MPRCPLGAALLYAGLVAFVQVAPSIAQQSGVSGGGGSGLLWTKKPIRVNPDQQALPRLPNRVENDAYPEKIYVPQGVKVPDSTTFVFGGMTYRLTGVASVPPRYICRDATGKRWSCGLRSRTTLRALIAGKQIECKNVPGAGNEILVVDCEISPGMTLARALLISGAAIPAPTKGAEFTREVSRAIRTRVGIWSDVSFFTQNRAVKEDD